MNEKLYTQFQNSVAKRNAAIISDIGSGLSSKELSDKYALSYQSIRDLKVNFRKRGLLKKKEK